ncbi:NAD-dependent epimerase/dehydratase family protein [Fodinicurvata sediminis]|uniref:NAD-dependent epimerase/dehydratase family protein n=1 Tax=Fodinicurvata sediminis TaxID=1121832 RepID=UPI0009DB8129|nr:NAD(P)-dependent oxidoreductase [Fodinicurvata sediminis]
MRVLVTGATGFIGRAVLEILETHDVETICVGRTRPVSDCEFHAMDLLECREFKSTFRELRPTHLLHLAWYTKHGQFWASPDNLRWVDATIRMTEAFCEAGGQHIVAAGTCAEYDLSYGYCREDLTPPSPESLYGTAKDATRRLVSKTCADKGVSCAWGRVFFPYGEGEPSTKLIPQVVRVLSGRSDALEVNGHHFRDFLHIDDVARGFWALLQQEATGVYNVSSGEPVSIAAVVKELGRLMQSDAHRVQMRKQGEDCGPHLICGDNRKLRELGWRPTLPLQSGLQKTLADLNLH